MTGARYLAASEHSRLMGNNEPDDDRQAKGEPMTTDKLREAAQAVVDEKRFLGGDGYDPIPLKLTGLISELKSALAAESDGGELVTREWFLQEYPAGEIRFRFDQRCESWIVQCVPDGTVHLSSRKTNVQTRNDLRTLIRLLGGENK